MSWLVYHKEPITLHSGDKSHWFVNGQAIFDDPHLRESVLAYWQSQLNPIAPWHFVGIPRGGVPWARAIAERMGKTWGVPTDPPQSCQVAVDDVVTTGASIAAVDAAKRLAVVSRCHGCAVQFIAWAHINLELTP